ncbi:MAG: hypothetical protein WCD18_23505 [Thermosynechococcaceae cyanobacterium]
MMNLLIFGVIGLMVVITALLSVQNATAVALVWLGLQSIQLPFGLVLSLSFALGLMLAAGVPWVWRWTAKGVLLGRARVPNRSKRNPKRT